MCETRSINDQDSAYLAHIALFHRFHYWYYHTLVVKILHLKFHFHPLAGLYHPLHNELYNLPLSFIVFFAAVSYCMHSLKVRTAAHFIPRSFRTLHCSE